MIWFWFITVPSSSCNLNTFRHTTNLQQTTLRTPRTWHIHINDSITIIFVHNKQAFIFACNTLTMSRIFTGCIWILNSFPAMTCLSDIPISILSNGFSMRYFEVMQNNHYKLHLLILSHIHLQILSRLIRCGKRRNTEQFLLLPQYYQPHSIIVHSFIVWILNCY